MAPKWTITYFNGKGRGEAIRLALVAGGRDFEDRRIEFADWPAEKPKTPHGSMPVLTIDGKTQIPQTMAILRYVARECNLYGKTTMDGCKIDVVLDTGKEMFEKFVGAVFSKEKEEAMKKFKEEDQPTLLNRLEGCACGTGGFMVGSNLSVADIYLYSIMENMKLLEELDKFPKMKTAVAKVKENKKVAEYLKKRPVTDL